VAPFSGTGEWLNPAVICYYPWLSAVCKINKEIPMAAINELVLVHIDNKPGFYARIEDIIPDMKPGWWQVKLLALSFPLQVFTWILDTSQVDGAPFTMGGTPVQLEKVVSPVESHTSLQEAPEKKEKKAGGKVVSLVDRKKEK
jgi:hypothetical protein